MKKVFAFALLLSLIGVNAMAQFTGPSTTGQPTTVKEALGSLPGTYVTVTGHIVAHLRGNYFTFRDATGDIRVEIENSVWENRKIGPETKVRLLGEVDVGFAGRYLWIKSLQVVQ